MYHLPLHLAHATRRSQRVLIFAIMSLFIKGLSEEQTAVRGRVSSPSPVIPRDRSPPPTPQMPDAGQETRRDHSEGVVPAEGPSLSPGAQRKSWRRSTMSRRSLAALPSPSQSESFCPPASYWEVSFLQCSSLTLRCFSSVLCRSISPSLPQQERLEKLMEASMKVRL